MYQFLLVFRSDLDGSDYRTIMSANSPEEAEAAAREKLPDGLRCVRRQRR